MTEIKRDWVFSGDITFPGRILVSAATKEEAIAIVERGLDPMDEVWVILDYESKDTLADFNWDLNDDQVQEWGE